MEEKGFYRTPVKMVGARPGADWGDFSGQLSEGKSPAVRESSITGGKERCFLPLATLKGHTVLWDNIL